MSFSFQVPSLEDLEAAAQARTVPRPTLLPQPQAAQPPPQAAQPRPQQPAPGAQGAGGGSTAPAQPRPPPNGAPGAGASSSRGSGGGGGGAGASSGGGGASSASSTAAGAAAPMLSLSAARGTGAKAIILVHERQRGNPLLQCFRHIPWEYAVGLASDFVVGAAACANFLSVKYHLLKPAYLDKRLRAVPREGAPGGFRLRLVVVHRDVEDSDASVLDITRQCTALGWTVLLAASLEEAARYLESFKAFEHKSASAIQERLEDSHAARAQDVLTGVRAINKTDAATLLGALPTMASIFLARREQLAQLPGLGEKKLARLQEAFNAPFRGGEEEEGAAGGGGGHMAADDIDD